jgi:hypothetical protein
MKGLLALTAVSLLAFLGCVAGAVVTDPPAATTTPTPTTKPSETAPTQPVGSGQELAAVSASLPTAAAADAMAKCHIRDMIEIGKVAGMAQLPNAAELLRYVPLTGREPQLKEAGPVWVIQIKGDVQEMGGEVWTNPICVVTESDFGYFATGPVTNTSTGKTTQPEAPAAAPDRTLPPLAP